MIRLAQHCLPHHLIIYHLRRHFVVALYLFPWSFWTNYSNLNWWHIYASAIYQHQHGFLCHFWRSGIGERTNFRKQDRNVHTVNDRIMILVWQQWQLLSNNLNITIELPQWQDYYCQLKAKTMLNLYLRFTCNRFFITSSWNRIKRKKKRMWFFVVSFHTTSHSSSFFL